MIICEDTRQQTGKHDLKHEYFAAHGIQVVRSKLYVGDYSLLTDQRVCIDTKMGLGELVSDCGSQHARFRDELIRAQAAGIRLVILTEDPKIRTLRQVFDWQNPQLVMHPKAMTGKRLYEIVRTMQLRYGAEFLFCHPNSTGRIIVELLGGNDGK